MIERIALNKGAYLNVKEIATREGVSPKFVNGFLDDIGSNVKWWGDSLFCNLSCSFLNGLFYSRNLDKLIAVADGIVYAIDSAGAATAISSAVLEPTAFVSFVEAPGLLDTEATYSPKVFMCNGGYIYYTDGSTVTKVDVTNCPTAATQLTYSDFQIISTYSERFFIHSEPGAVIDFGTSSNIIAADSSPDDLVGLIALNRELLVFGTQTVDTFFFSDYASTVTWLKTAGALVDQGCSARHTIRLIDNTVFWLNHRREVVKLTGRTPAVISTSINKALQDLTTVSDAIAHHVIYGGKNLYVLLFPTENVAYAYDYVQDYWVQLGTWSSGLGDYNAFPMFGYAFHTTLNKAFYGTSSGGIYQINQDIATNAGITNRFVRRTGHISHGSLRNRKRCNRVTFLVESGYGTATTEPVFSVRYRDQNGPWSNEVFPSLRQLGDYTFLAEMFNCGTYQTRQWEIVQTDSVPFTLVFMEEEFEVQL
jgi:hypothetical protein